MASVEAAPHAKHHDYHLVDPSPWPAVGALFAFIISFDEPVVSFFVSSVRQRTLPRRMFEDIEQNLTPVIPAIATLLTLLSIAVLIAVALLRVLERRRRAE